eukprot:768793-Hanusia_phi.AAC.9
MERQEGKQIIIDSQQVRPQRARVDHKRNTHSSARAIEGKHYTTWWRSKHWRGRKHAVRRDNPTLNSMEVWQASHVHAADWSVHVSRSLWSVESSFHCARSSAGLRSSSL